MTVAVLTLLQGSRYFAAKGKATPGANRTGRPPKKKRPPPRVIPLLNRKARAARAKSWSLAPNGQIAKKKFVGQ
jgi:hypothetical protein